MTSFQINQAAKQWNGWRALALFPYRSDYPVHVKVLNDAKLRTRLVERDLGGGLLRRQKHRRGCDDDDEKAIESHSK